MHLILCRKITSSTGVSRLVQPAAPKATQARAVAHGSNLPAGGRKRMAPPKPRRAREAKKLFRKIARRPAPAYFFSTGFAASFFTASVFGPVTFAPFASAGFSSSQHEPSSHFASAFGFSAAGAFAVSTAKVNEAAARAARKRRSFFMGTAIGRN